MITTPNQENNASYASYDMADGLATLALYNKKSNAPYYIIGGLAAFTSLASGTFAVAPHVPFLAPIAALGLSTPLIAAFAMSSIIVLAFSAVKINKNQAQPAKWADSILDTKDQLDKFAKSLSASASAENAPNVQENETFHDAKSTFDAQENETFYDAESEPLSKVDNTTDLSKSTAPSLRT